MTTLQIEFFHDVICSFCFPMSYRMRQLKAMMPELNIVHRSFALAKDGKAMEMMFGSREKAKLEVLQHWVHANQNDELHRFNIEGMKKQDFLFPTSTNGLRAAKAAAFTGGEEAYWDVFDALQKALFMNSRNIEDNAVIFDVVKNTVANFEEWKAHYESEALTQAVESDLSLAQAYGIHSVPSLVVEGKYLINGALPLDHLHATFLQMLDEKRKETKVKPVAFHPDHDDGSNTCNLVDGKWKCE